jgi:hypothetical protein
MDRSIVVHRVIAAGAVKVATVIARDGPESLRNALDADGFLVAVLVALRKLGFAGHVAVHAMKAFGPTVAQGHLQYMRQRHSHNQSGYFPKCEQNRTAPSGAACTARDRPGIRRACNYPLWLQRACSALGEGLSRTGSENSEGRVVGRIDSQVQSRSARWRAACSVPEIIVPARPRSPSLPKF